MAFLSSYVTNSAYALRRWAGMAGGKERPPRLRALRMGEGMKAQLVWLVGSPKIYKSLILKDFSRPKIEECDSV